jgi:hypothetical protein
MKTYKYLGEKSALCFLTKQSIRFSQPKAFNDPFEMQPEFWVLNRDLMNKTQNPCQFVIHGHQKLSDKYLIKDLGAVEKLATVDTRKLVSDFNDAIAILCLTKADTLLPNNLLMWAHYAESHRGIVIEFNESDFASKAVEIKYSPNRPVIDASLLYENEYIAIEDLYYKHSCWSYEYEHRITCKLDECEQIPDIKDPLGNDIYIKSVPIESIRCIYIGCNASKEIKKLAFEIHKECGVHFMFLKVHKEEYKLIPYTSFGPSLSDVRMLTEEILFKRDKI